MPTARHRLAAEYKFQRKRREIPTSDSGSDDNSDVPLKRHRSAESDFDEVYRDYIRAVSAVAWEPALFAAGSGVAEKVKRCYDENRISEEKLTEILTTATKLIKNREYSNQDNFKATLNKFHRLSKSVGSFPWGKVLAGVMLTLIGAIILVASGLVIAVSLGFFPPITVIFGITLAASLVNTGISAATGAVGIASMVTAGMLFFKAGTPSHLKSHMNRLESELRHPTAQN